MKLELYTVILIGIAVVAAIVIAFIIKDSLAKKEVTEIVKSYFPNAKIDYGKDKYIMRVEDEKGIFYFHYIMIPSNSAITINYEYTWQLFYGGSKEKKGRAYPNTRFLEEIKDFCKFRPAEEDAKKVCIIYKETEHKNMYINENELIELDVYVKKYNYYLVEFNKFSLDMSKVIGE